MYKATVFCVLFLVSSYRVDAMTTTELSFCPAAINKCSDACPLKSELDDRNKRNTELIKKIMEDQVDVMLFAQLVGSKVNRKDKQDIINQLIKNSSQLELVLALDLVSSKKAVDVKTIVTCAKKTLQGMLQQNYSLSEDTVATHERSLNETIMRLNQEKQELFFIVNELSMQLKEKNKALDDIVQEIER